MKNDLKEATMCRESINIGARCGPKRHASKMVGWRVRGDIMQLDGGQGGGGGNVLACQEKKCSLEMTEIASRHAVFQKCR